MASTDYLRNNILLLQLGRQFRINNSASIGFKVLHHFWRLLCNFCLVFLTVGFFLDIKNKRELPFTVVAINYEYLAITFCVFQKCNYHYIFDYKAEKFVQKLNNLIRYETNTGMEEKKMKYAIKMANALTFSWFVSATIVAITFFMVRLILGNNLERNLPMPLWYPYDWKSSPIYELTCATQFFLQAVLVSIWISTDVFFSSTMLLTAEQFKLLGWEFKNILYTVLLRVGVTKDEVVGFKMEFEASESALTYEGHYTKIYETIFSDKFEREMMRRINELIGYHQRLVSLCDDLEDFYSPIMLLFWFISLLVITFVTSLLMTTDDVAMIITGMVYFFSGTFSLWFSCVISDHLTTQSERLRNDIYEMPWYMCDKKCKSTFQFVLHRVNKEVVITAGKFSSLNLSLFLATLRAAFSYALILSQLTEQK